MFSRILCLALFAVVSRAQIGSVAVEQDFFPSGSDCSAKNPVSFAKVVFPGSFHYCLKYYPDSSNCVASSPTSLKMKQQCIPSLDASVPGGNATTPYLITTTYGNETSCSDPGAVIAVAGVVADGVTCIVSSDPKGLNNIYSCKGGNYAKYTCDSGATCKNCQMVATAADKTCSPSDSNNSVQYSCTSFVNSTQVTPLVVNQQDIYDGNDGDCSKAPVAFSRLYNIGDLSTCQASLPDKPNQCIDQAKYRCIATTADPLPPKAAGTYLLSNYYAASNCAESSISSAIGQVADGKCRFDGTAYYSATCTATSAVFNVCSDSACKNCVPQFQDVPNTCNIGQATQAGYYRKSFCLVAPPKNAGALSAAPSSVLALIAFAMAFFYF